MINESDGFSRQDSTDVKEELQARDLALSFASFEVSKSLLLKFVSKLAAVFFVNEPLFYKNVSLIPRWCVPFRDCNSALGLNRDWAGLKLLSN